MHAQTHSTAAVFRSGQGSVFYIGGCMVVIYGWTVVGLLLEAYGFWLLFCEFFPTVLQFLRRVPVLGKILDMPLLKMVGECEASAWGLLGGRMHSPMHTHMLCAQP